MKKKRSKKKKGFKANPTTKHPSKKEPLGGGGRQGGKRKDSKPRNFVFRQKNNTSSEQATKGGVFVRRKRARNAASRKWGAWIDSKRRLGGEGVGGVKNSQRFGKTAFWRGKKKKKKKI